MEIVDLHCDLLAYLALNPDRTPLDPVVRCSGPQLKAGNVKIQILAISSETNYQSLLLGLKQLEIFLSLPTKYPEFFSETSILPAFENASAFCMEKEPLSQVFKRLEWIFEQISPLYISLTWNGENRFGGGCGCLKGLKSDGKELLAFLDGRNIAIDFSHTSDPLAHDILNFIDRSNLDLPVMASHSNFRSVQNHPRNLPDEIAKEIIHRKGLIGLVFYRPFLGAPENLSKQIEYGLQLGGEDSLAFGADFFHPEDFPQLIDPEGFFEEMYDSSKYPLILKTLTGFSQSQIEKIALNNFFNFYSKNK